MPSTGLSSLEGVSAVIWSIGGSGKDVTEESLGRKVKMEINLGREA